MATYFIFPEKDTTIYSNPLKTSLNTGLDEILEISKEPDTNFNSRILIKFNTEEIIDVLENKIGSEIPFSSSLQLFSTEHKELGFEQNLIVHPVSESWENGRGRHNNSPQTIDGVSWLYRDGINLWTSSGSTFLNEYSSSQNFNFDFELDTNIDLTDQILLLYSGSIENHGFVVKRTENQETEDINLGSLKYFSKETHTIYPPRLKFQWNDSSYVTGSLQVVNSGSFVVHFKDVPNKITWKNTQRFKLFVRPKYPLRTFKTTNFISSNHALPESSYYSLIDYKTGDILIDFNNFSKLSCNSEGMFFDLDTNGLQPERYYKILLNINNDEGSKVIDNDLIFKLVR